MKLDRVAGRCAGLVVALAALLLSACSGQREVRSGPLPARATVSESLWHLRAGLNVAALSCRGRGRVTVAADYRRVISRHASLMNAAYAEEQRRYGASGYDHHATQIYNKFANQRSPERFCRTASGVARRAAGMNSAQLGEDAPGLLSELRHATG